MRSQAVRLVWLAAALIALSDTALAQGPNGSWQLAPRAGVFYPATALGDVPISTQIAGVAEAPRQSKLSAGAAVGISFVRKLGAGNTRVRLDIDYVPPVDVSIDGHESPVVQATVAAVLAGVEQSLMRDPGVIRPFVTAAAGFRSLRFQPARSSGPQFPDGQVSPALRVGFGTMLRVSVLSIGGEVTNQMSTFRFEGGGGRKLLNDLHGILSIRVGLF
jgi:hypothetical protein